MNVGVGLPNTLAGIESDEAITWAQAAESGPFTSVGVFDRLRYHSLDPISTLAACAGATNDIELVSSIVAGPIRTDALLAKQAATIDVLSDGRLTLGLALGARRDDYETADVDYSSRGKRFTRQLSRLRDFWTGDEVGPTPIQDGGPTLLVGGQSDPTFKRVSRFADGYIHGGGPPNAFNKQAERARAAWAATDRPGTPDLWGHGYFALGDEDIQQAGRDYLLDYYAFTGPFAERIADGLLTTPQEVVQFVRGYEDAGCDELLLFPTVPGMAQYDRLEAIVAGELG